MNNPATQGLELDQLRISRADYADIAKQTQQTLAALDFQIAKAEMLIRKNEQRDYARTLSPDAVENLTGREFIFLINRSSAMGEGFSAYIGEAVRAAAELKSAADVVVEDIRTAKINALKDAAKERGEVETTVDPRTIAVPLSVGAAFWGSGNSVAVKFDDAGALQSLVGKTAPGRACDLLPVAKEMLNRNTPDVVSTLHRHYVLITPNDVADDTIAAAKIMEAASILNPRLTLDIIVCGRYDEGNIDQIAPRVRGTNVFEASTPAEIKQAVDALVKKRVAGSTVTPGNNMERAFESPGLTD